MRGSGGKARVISTAKTIPRKLLSLSRKGKRLIVQRWFLFMIPDFKWSGGEIGSRVSVRITDGGRCEVKEGLSLADDCKLIVQGGTLTIGRSSFVGFGTVTACKERISIGDFALIADYVTIRDQNHSYGLRTPMSESGFETSAIAIGTNVWIGAKVTITRGVVIGDNVVVGAKTVITKDIPANTVVGGVPSRIIRSVSDKSFDTLE